MGLVAGCGRLAGGRSIGRSESVEIALENGISDEISGSECGERLAEESARFFGEAVERPVVVTLRGDELVFAKVGKLL